MIIKPFKVEQWMNEFEDDAVYNIGETCVHSVTLKELLELSGENREGFMEKVMDRRLTYGYISGAPEFKEGICRLYENLRPGNILTAHGAIGANHLALYSIVEPGDRVISVLPTYQQLYSIPESFGAEVKLLKLRPEKEFLPDLEELKSMVNSSTKVICINNPNNPTGALMSEEILRAVAEIAKGAGAYVLCDEVYRGLAQEGYSKSIVDIYDKGISTGSMSKVFSLAGLRLGWIAAPEDIIAKCFEHRDYNTISCGMLDEMIAGLALRHADKLLERNRAMVARNLEILDGWVSKEPRISYVKPKAGTTALLYFDAQMSSREFCVLLMKKYGVLLTPGSCFEMEKCARIGYACSTEILEQGLEKLSEFLKGL